MKAIAIIISIILLTSCATKRKSQMASMGLGFAAGGTVGAMTAPEDEKPTMHGALWGGLTAALAGAISLYVFDNQKEVDSFKEETETLKIELSHLKKAQEPRLVSKGSGLFKDPLPKEALRLIQPGEWRKYAVDQWVQDQGNPNIWLHYNQMYEFIPPSVGQ